MSEQTASLFKQIKLTEITHAQVKMHTPSVHEYFYHSSQLEITAYVMHNYRRISKIKHKFRGGRVNYYSGRS